MRVKCKCGKFVPVNLYIPDDISVTGKPKLIGDGKCDCGKKIKVYATIHRSD